MRDGLSVLAENTNGGGETTTMDRSLVSLANSAKSNFKPRIVHTEKYESGSYRGDHGQRNDCHLSPFTRTGGITTVNTSIDYASKEDRDAALASGMTDGMEMGYCNLDKVLIP